MPKLHDACQILAQEIIDSLVVFAEDQRPEALASIVHAVEEDLVTRRPDGLRISQHLWIVLTEYIEGRGAGWQIGSRLPEGEPSLAMASEEALTEARRLFP